MAHQHLPSDWIPRLQLGQTVYEHYPIQEMTREESDRILSRPDRAHQILLRTSESSRRIHPNLYYVASYRIPGRENPMNLIVTRQIHEEHGGELHRYLPDLPPGQSYSLALFPDSPFFMRTTSFSHENLNEYRLPTETSRQ